MRHGFRLALWVAVIYTVCLLLFGVAAWIDGRGLVDADHTRYLMFIPMAGIAAAIYAIVFAARRQLRRRFLSREAPTFEQWMERHYPAGDVSPESTRVILATVAQGVGGGAQPTQLLPADRLDEDFVYRLCGTAIDRDDLLNGPLEDFHERLCEWFAEQTGRSLQWDVSWETLDDVIRGVSARLDESEAPPGGAS